MLAWESFPVREPLHFFNKTHRVTSPASSLAHARILMGAVSFEDNPQLHRHARRPKTMPSIDRRATPRFQPKPGNHITYGERSADIRDLSLEGVFICDTDPLPVGSEIIFTLRAGDQDISLEGVVRHSLDQQGMGIQFTKVTPVSKRRLRIHLASLVSAPGQVVKT
jgi:hypothetical protein